MLGRYPIPKLPSTPLKLNILTTMTPPCQPTFCRSNVSLARSVQLAFEYRGVCIWLKSIKLYNHTSCSCVGEVEETPTIARKGSSTKKIIYGITVAFLISLCQLRTCVFSCSCYWIFSMLPFSHRRSRRSGKKMNHGRNEHVRLWKLAWNYPET